MIYNKTTLSVQGDTCLKVAICFAFYVLFGPAYIQYAHLIGLEIIANSYFQVVESEATDMCRGKAESGQRTGRTLDLLTTHHPEHICGYQTMCIFVH